jgi:hypothetical protein
MTSRLATFGMLPETYAPAPPVDVKNTVDAFKRLSVDSASEHPAALPAPTAPPQPSVVHRLEATQTFKAGTPIKPLPAICMGTVHDSSNGASRRCSNKSTEWYFENGYCMACIGVLLDCISLGKSDHECARCGVHFSDKWRKDEGTVRCNTCDTARKSSWLEGETLLPYGKKLKEWVAFAVLCRIKLATTSAEVHPPNRHLWIPAAVLDMEQHGRISAEQFVDALACGKARAVYKPLWDKLQKSKRLTEADLKHLKWSFNFQGANLQEPTALLGH